MSQKQSFQERYETGDTPWEIRRPDHNLTTMVKQAPIKPSKAIDIGCGSGNNAIWLAEQGFTMTGCDNSETAIKQAKEKTKAAKVTCSFQVTDFLHDVIPGAPFPFAFDRGCFHCFKEEGFLSEYAQKIATILEDNGTWLSLIGNSDEPRTEDGPPQLSALMISQTVEPFFEILSLTSGYFDSKLSPAPRNWICLMRKRAL